MKKAPPCRVRANTHYALRPRPEVILIGEVVHANNLFSQEKTMTIPDTHKDLIEGPIVVALSTVMPDGRPQTTPVWCNYDGTHILVNTARGRQKDKNLTARPMATILVIDPQNPYRYLEIRGQVAEVTEAGAVEHINQLGVLYTGKSFFKPGQKSPATRVIYKIKPVHVVASG
jgi:PPOX class probable F420-dependent enzyme